MINRFILLISSLFTLSYMTDSYASGQESDVDQLMSLLQGTDMYTARLPIEEIRAGTYTTERHNFVIKDAAAKSGSVGDMVVLASYYINGEGCKQNHAEAFKWLEKALAPKAKFDAEGIHRIGRLYGMLNLPSHIETIHSRIVTCFRKSLELGNEPVRIELAHALYRQATPKSYAEAYEHYTFLTEKQKSGEAAHCLSHLIETDRVKYSKSKKEKRVAELIKLAAKYGYDLAIGNYVCNVMKRVPNFTDEADKKRVVELCEQQIAKENWKYYDDLGKLYYKGLGVQHDPKRALELFIEGTKKGVLYCYHSCGEVYEFGMLGEPNIQEAYKYYLSGAMAGQSHCMNAVGQLAYKGCLKGGVNLPLAITWFRKAMANGCESAVYNLAVALFGSGDPKDAVESIELYKRSRHLHPFNADCTIGLAYYKGIGVKVDHEIALKYLKPHEENPDVKKIVADIYLLQKKYPEALACYEGCIKADIPVSDDFMNDLRSLVEAQKQKPTGKRRNIVPMLVQQARLEQIKELSKTVQRETMALLERLKPNETTDQFLSTEDRCAMFRDLTNIMASAIDACKASNDMAQIETDLKKYMSVITDVKQRLAMAESARQADEVLTRRRAVHMGVRNNDSDGQVGPDRSEQREIKQAALVRISSQKNLKRMHDMRPNADPSGRESEPSPVATEPLALVPGPFAKTFLEKEVAAEIKNKNWHKALFIKDQVCLAQDVSDLFERLSKLGEGYDFKDLSKTEYAKQYGADRLYQLRINKKYRVFVPLKLVDGCWTVVNNNVYLVQPHKG